MPTLICDVDQALLRADLWRVLSLCFARPTTQSMADLHQLSRDLAGVLGTTNHPLHAGLVDLSDCVAELDPIALEHEHNALFSMDVLVPAYEGSYQRIERGTVIGDVAGYYRAFELAPVEQSGPPDSLWNELAFVAWLSLKEAYAEDQGMTEALAITREAMAEFLQDHLGRWTGAFANRLLETTANPMYCTGAHLLMATVSMVADELQIEQISPLEARALSDESEEVSCFSGCPKP
ncbi:MAG: hypothetical protein HN796_04560 [Gemmatimonadetes bacterium]|jgi:putative dimethyl sulfoxide reductase chaperone|nr:hypothetical protein [Gemmatimonadota bacterium]